MKTLFCLLFLVSFSAVANEAISYVKTFDNKIYSLRSKGVKDFVVDIKSSKLSKQVNDEGIFGKVDKLKFRLYWTAQPERLSVEVMGLPEGFKEVKEGLKASVVGMLDSLLPISIPDRFAGYDISKSSSSKEILVKDKTGLAPVPSYTLRFDSDDKLIEIVGHKPVGTQNIMLNYKKQPFSDGKWVLASQVSTVEENVQTIISRRDLEYGSSQGMGVLSSITVSSQQKWSDPKLKPVIQEETIEFTDYKINNGDGLKYFLGESQK